MCSVVRFYVYCTALNCTAQHETALPYIVLYCTVLYDVELVKAQLCNAFPKAWTRFALQLRAVTCLVYLAVPCCTVLCPSVLFCSVLYRTIPHPDNARKCWAALHLASLQPEILKRGNYLISAFWNFELQSGYAAPNFAVFTWYEIYFEMGSLILDLAPQLCF